MKYVDREIDQYWVHFQAGSKEKNKAYPRALIKCYSGDEFLVQLTFYAEGKNMPKNHYDKRNKLVYLRYPLHMYEYILDILRNEKPIFFRYNIEIGLGFIRTGKEPIGEGEYDADFI